MKPSPEPKRTEATVITDRLRDEIVQGVVAPGAKLKLVPLARRYEVSRGPLREAASRLASEGLVTIEDQRGFRVRPISRADLLDVTTTRQRIELLALRDAISHGDLDWEGRVMAALHKLDRVTHATEVPDAFLVHHRAFHAELVSACPSTYLLAFRERLYALSERYRHLAASRYQSARAERDIAGEHQQLAEAAVERRADDACALLEAHLQETANTLVEGFPTLFGTQAD